MGRKHFDMQIDCSVSNHNSDQDLKDEASWEEFVNRVKAIASEHRYAEIGIEVTADGVLE